jgi:hypothetical protein
VVPPAAPKKPAPAAEGNTTALPKGETRETLPEQVKDHIAAQPAAPVKDKIKAPSSQRPLEAAAAAPRLEESKPSAHAAAQDKAQDTFSILDFGEPTENLEVVDVESEGDNMDLSLIFDESAIAEDAASAAAKKTDKTAPKITEPITLRTSPGEAAAQAKSKLEVTDHGVKNHGVIRKPLSRVPQTFRESEAYSDFLKKTKSVFFRIKWSLFKD